MKSKKLFIVLMLILTEAGNGQSQSSMVFDSGTTISVTGSGDICADAVTINGSYSGDGTKCGSSPLPVELVLFTAVYQNNQVVLNWETATEVNNYGFEILRSAINQSSWQKIGFVNGSGNSNSPKKYSFVDNSALYNTLDYRLKQINIDGGFDLSDIVRVKVGNKPEVYDEKIFPNPFNPLTIIRIDLPTGTHVSLSIYNALGEKVATLLDEYRGEGVYQIEFNGAAFPSGVYFSVLKSDKASITRKMILLK